MECLLNQLTTEKLTREVRKAAIGFLSAGDGFSKIPVVSGWWGCGAFRGNKPLKCTFFFFRFIQNSFSATASFPMDGKMNIAYHFAE